MQSSTSTGSNEYGHYTSKYKWTSPVGSWEPKEPVDVPRLVSFRPGPAPVLPSPPSIVEKKGEENLIEGRDALKNQKLSDDSPIPKTKARELEGDEEDSLDTEEEDDGKVSGEGGEEGEEEEILLIAEALGDKGDGIRYGPRSPIRAQKTDEHSLIDQAEAIRSAAHKRLTEEFQKKSGKSELDAEAKRQIDRLAKDETNRVLKSTADVSLGFVQDAIVMQESKDDFALPFQDVLRFLDDSQLSMDTELIEAFWSEEPLGEVSNAFVEMAAHESAALPPLTSTCLLKLLFEGRSPSTLLRNGRGQVVPPGPILSDLLDAREALRNYIKNHQKDDRTSGLQFVATSSDLFERVYDQATSFFQMRVNALEFERQALGEHVSSRSVSPKAPEYHLIFLGQLMLQQMEEMLAEFGDMLQDWSEDILGEQSGEDEEDDEDDDEEDEPAGKKKKKIGGKKAEVEFKPGMTLYDDDDDDDDDDDEGDKKGTVTPRKTPAKSPQPKSPPKKVAEKTPPQKKAAKKTEVEPQLKDASSSDSDSSEESREKVPLPPKNVPTTGPEAAALKKAAEEKATGTPAKKGGDKKGTPAKSPKPIDSLAKEKKREKSEGEEGEGEEEGAEDGDQEVPFKTLLVFIKELQKSALPPPSHLVTALLQGDLRFLLLNAPSSSLPKLPPGVLALALAERTLLISSKQANSVSVGRLIGFLADLPLLSQPPSPDSASLLSLHLRHWVTMLGSALGLLAAFVFHFAPSTWKLSSSSLLTTSFPFCLRPISEMIMMPNGTSRPLYELLEEYYHEVYHSHPRVKEWTKDKAARHRTPSPISATEMKRLHLHYEKKVPVAPELTSLVQWPKITISKGDEKK